MALSGRIIRQFWHDKRSLALLLIAPMLIIWLLSLVFAGEEYQPVIGVVQLPEEVVSLFEEEGGKITVYSEEEAEQALQAGDVDAVIKMEDQKMMLTLEGSDPSSNQAVLLLMQNVRQHMFPNAPTQQIEIAYLYGSADLASFDYFGPVLVGFFAFFFVFLLSGVSFLRERTGGTLERLLASPIRRWEIVAGYFLGFGFFAIIQAIIITWFAIHILDMYMVGSFAYVLLVNLLLAMTALTLGILLSAYAHNELQMIQFIPLVIVPQVFFSGLFNLETMAEWLRGISVIMPLYYGADALRDVMVRGKGWHEIDFDVYMLCAFSFVFMLLNMLALRKHRRI